MKNYVQMGATLTYVAVAAAISGQPFLLDGLFGIASGDAAIGEDVEVALTGVYTLTKKSADTPAAFQKAYWDDTLKEVTTTSAGMTLIGVFTEAYIAATTEAKIRLNGISV